MSRYIFRGDNPRYRLTVGVDTPLSTLFAQVEDLAWESNGAVIDEHVEIGDMPVEGLLVWVGGSTCEIVDVQELVLAVAPYGRVPLPLQVALLRDLDRIFPQPLMELGVQLAQICQQAPSARLAHHPDPHSSSYIILNEEGWHLRGWDTLPACPLTQAFAELLDPASGEQPRRDPESILSYVSDPSIMFSVQENSFTESRA